jgi:hypothetical protein
MVRSNLFGADGLAHPRPIHENKAKKRRERHDEDAKVCIGCTRKKCSGRAECMQKRKQQMSE